MPEIDFRGKEAEWLQFFQMIREAFPHCRVDNLVVVNGAPWGYARIHYSDVPPREARRPARERDDGFNPDWAWFILKCQHLKDGIMLEVHFRDANPITVFGEQAAMGRFIGPQGGDRTEPRRALALR